MIPPSLILSTATRYLTPLLLLFSAFLLMRGHNEPGGGFIGGLVASAAFALYTIAHGVQMAQRALRVEPRTLIGIGLLISLISGILGLLINKPFLTATWSEQEIPVIGKAGTPLLFDIGVYILVIGITLTIIFSLAERQGEE
jgi:multicomponent Na+:H+ antiporter subunit B